MGAWADELPTCVCARTCGLHRRSELRRVNFGGGGGYGGGDVGWFPLGPREVYVPGYNTSRGYVDRVNTSNTNVSNTTITNVYNNQVTNNNITNVTYVNRAVPGAVTAVPQNCLQEL